MIQVLHSFVTHANVQSTERLYITQKPTSFLALGGTLYTRRESPHDMIVAKVEVMQYSPVETCGHRLRKRGELHLGAIVVRTFRACVARL
ncbi:unnamed protein product [Leptosia nina]|uniref:Uncharacterized protein n=1 Tax=Leptosia nina TaxID=320188 RepID=A0AAV1IV94_9NEOP